MAGSAQRAFRPRTARKRMLSDEVLADPIAEMVRQSSTPDTCGDVVAVLKPYYYLGDPISTKLCATHGSPHPYDTHVPLLVMGPGIKPGEHEERIAPQSMVFMLAQILAIDPPLGARLEYAVPTDQWLTKD